MNVWMIILSVAMAALVVSLVILYRHLYFARPVVLLSGKRKRLRFVLPLGAFVVFGVFCIFDLVNSVIVMLHLAVFCLIVDFLIVLIRILRREGPETDEEKAERKKQYRTRGDYRILAVIVLTALYLAYGWYSAHHVVRTSYDIYTYRFVGREKLRIAMIADSHIGTTFDGEGFAEQLERIKDEKPDIFFIVGDFVDDGTTKEDMLTAVKALGNFETTFGTYYVSGNHDKGYYGSKRGFTYEEMTAEMERAGVKVLADESVFLNNSFYVIGRKDRGDRNRKSVKELVEGHFSNAFTIVLDHQPGEFDLEQQAGVDLVLCGHTHGGQLLPINYVGEWTKTNDMTYGHRGNYGTTYIVTSGISDWAIKFKTGCKSEYVIIDVTQQQ